jgi:pancreatic triacylglycerol lipase
VITFDSFISDTPKDFEYVSLNETSKLLNHPKYDNDRPTMLYGYGYTEKYKSKSTQTVVDSYIERGDHNILVVEWSNYSDGSYIFRAIPNSHKVGSIVGKTLLNMRNEGFNIDKFHLVGHSLGGHLVGYIGRSVYKNSNQTYKLTRITALDPAGLFNDFNS